MASRRYQEKGFHQRFSVMAGLVPAIHVLAISQRRKAWMPGTRPGMTAEQKKSLGLAAGALIRSFAHM
jgi:hypothetical protein